MEKGDLLILTKAVQRMLREPEDFEQQGELLKVVSDSPTLWKLLPIGLIVRFIGKAEGSTVFEIVDTPEVGGDAGLFSQKYKQMRFMPGSYMGLFRKL